MNIYLISLFLAVDYELRKQSWIDHVLFFQEVHNEMFLKNTMVSIQMVKIKC